MLRQFDGPFEIRTNGPGDRLLPEVMAVFAQLATEYNGARATVREFIVSNKDTLGRSVDTLERGHVQPFGDGSRTFFIHSGKFRKKRYKSSLFSVETSAGETVSTVTHEFAHLMYIDRYGQGSEMAAALADFKASELYRRYTQLRGAYTAERQTVVFRQRQVAQQELREGAKLDDVNYRLQERIHDDMRSWLSRRDDKDLFISEYAFASVDEMLAEGFAAYKLRSNPGPVAEAVGQLFDTHFKKE